MPKKREPSQDGSFQGEAPMKYRKYTAKAKNKLCFLVKVQGWKTSAAAKMLKFKSSTAKMVIYKFKHDNFEELRARLREKYSKGKKIKKNLEEAMEVAKVEDNEDKVLFYDYFDFDPEELAKHEEKE